MSMSTITRGVVLGGTSTALLFGAAGTALACEPGTAPAPAKPPVTQVSEHEQHKQFENKTVTERIKVPVVKTVTYTAYEKVAVEKTKIENYTVTKQVPYTVTTKVPYTETVKIKVFVGGHEWKDANGCKHAAKGHWEYKTVTVTKYKTVTETKYKTVTETKQREVHYTVWEVKPVQKTKTVTTWEWKTITKTVKVEKPCSCKVA